MIASLLVAFALAAGPLADLPVTVTDPSGGRVPEARVEVDAGSRQARSAVTSTQGQALVSGIEPGEHRVRVTLQGFEPWEKKVRIRDTASPLEVKLKLARVREDVSVTPEDARAGSSRYKTTLTEDDIANLPDDPDELEAALRGMAGPQAAFRVNGFSSGRLPPKSQIRQIRFVMNPYAPEFHESQPVFVDIQTKPGLGSWSRTARSGFRDDALNSRSPLAPSRVPDAYRRFGFDLAGPLVKDRTSLSLSAEARLTDTARTVRAETPSGLLSQLADSSTDRVDLSARVEHGWARAHTLRGEFSSLTRNEAGLGIGGFDLPERGYEQDRRETTASVADNGVLFGRMASEIRFQSRFESLDSTSKSADPAVRVLGAFNSGGAGITGGRSTRDLELAANFDLSVGKKHALRFGMLLRDLSVTSDEQRNAAGVYTFNDLASYESGQPALFTQRSGNPSVRYGQQQAGFYAQDEARLSKNFTLAGGLRLEGQSQVNGLFKAAPRVNFTWGLGSKMTLRGGSGIFFGWYDADTYEQTLRFDGQRETETLVSNPAWPDALQGSGSLVARSTRIATSPDLTLPRTWRSSLGFDRMLNSRLRLTFDYTYQRGSHELRSRNRSEAGSLLSVREIESTARSTRHTLDVRVNLMPQPTAKAGFFIGYLWQSARNEADSALSLPANETDLSAEWGRAANDARHRVFGLVNFNPTKQISMGALIFGQSGTPFDITTGRDDNGDTVFNDRPAGVSRNTGVGPSRFNVDFRIGWTRNFGGPRPSRPGDGMRVIRIGGGDGVPDTSSPGDPQRYKISLFLQAFNALNRTNPTAVGTILGSSLFGRPLATDPGRRIELGATLSF